MLVDAWRKIAGQSDTSHNKDYRCLSPNPLQKTSAYTEKESEPFTLLLQAKRLHIKSYLSCCNACIIKDNNQVELPWPLPLCLRNCCPHPEQQTVHGGVGKVTERSSGQAYHRCSSAAETRTIKDKYSWHLEPYHGPNRHVFLYRLKRKSVRSTLQ